MKSPRTSAAVVAPAPSVYEHSRQPQWGRAVVAATQTDRATYVFENAGERTFMNGYSSIVEVELAPEEREALAKRLLRGHASATSAGKAKSTKSTKSKSSSTTKAKKKRAPAPEQEDEPARLGDADE